MFKIIRVPVLVLLLACSALAGEIQNGTPQPPPPTASSETAREEATTATAEEGEGDLSNAVSDTLTEAALSVLGNVLALL